LVREEVREFIAVNDYAVLLRTADLKRQALMFDRVAVPFVKQVIDRGEYKGFDGALGEVEWLVDKGIVFEPKLQPDVNRIRDTEEFIRLSQDYNDVIDYLRGLANDPEKARAAWSAPVSPIVDTILTYFGIHARFVSLQLRVFDEMDAYPVLSAPIPQASSPSGKKGDVLHIGLNALPIPDGSTSWEQILEYRCDPDSRSKFLALRNWMSEVARDRLTPVEVEEKLEYLMDQYQQHMKLHRMKTNVGTLETIVITAAEVFGNLLSFKWGTAAKTLFSLKKRELELLEGELTAPGNEIAYIVKARQTFS